NGVGKTNLYRALELLQAAATGRLAEEVAREGGLASVIHAGPRQKSEAPRLLLEARLEDVLEGGGALDYGIELGFPQAITAAAFATETQVKRETVTLAGGRRGALLL